MSGDPNRMDFLSTSPGTDASGDVRRQHLALTSTGELDLSSTGLREPLTDWVQNHVLLRHVAGLKLSYFGASLDGVRDWRPNWLHGAAPPELIEIQVSFPAGDRRTWPDLIVRPGATVDTQCVLDPSTGGCRGRA